MSTSFHSFDLYKDCKSWNHFFTALRTKPPKSETGPKKSKRARRDENEKKFVESHDLLRSSDISGGNSGSAGLYKPKTAETKQTYEVMLSFIQEALGDQPRDILHGAADEVLRTLKDDRMREKEKKKETEELLGSQLPEERFALLVNLGKKITDFSAAALDQVWPLTQFLKDFLS